MATLLAPVSFFQKPNTAESRFLESPGETQIGLRNRGTTFQVIGRFEKVRVREIGNPLYPLFSVGQRVLGTHMVPILSKLSLLDCWKWMILG